MKKIKITIDTYNELRTFDTEEGWVDNVNEYKQIPAKVKLKFLCHFFRHNEETKYLKKMINVTKGEVDNVTGQFKTVEVNDKDYLFIEKLVNKYHTHIDNIILFLIKYAVEFVRTEGFSEIQYDDFLYYELG